MAELTLDAATRTHVGRQAKQERKAENIPAVVYGDGFESRPISVARNPFLKLLETAGGSTLIDLKVGADASFKALIKDVQRHPVTMEPIHIDFHQVRMDRVMHADIPLTFIGEPAAVKVLGGTLVKSRDEVSIECLPGDLPSHIDVPLDVLATFDDAITIADLHVHSGVTILDDPEEPVASVIPPLSEEELAKLEESQVGDVSEVKTEAEEKEGDESAEEGEEKKEGDEVKTAPADESESKE